MPEHEILQFALRRRGLNRPEPLLLARSGWVCAIPGKCPVSAPLLGKNLEAKKAAIEERATIMLPAWKSTGPEG